MLRFARTAALTAATLGLAAGVLAATPAFADPSPALRACYDDCFHTYGRNQAQLTVCHWQCDSLYGS